MHRLSFFRSRFFWKLYATYALLVLATTTVIGTLVAHQMGQALRSEVEASLRDRTLLIEPLALQAFRGVRPGATRHEITRLGQRVDVRITLIRPDGTVIADSERDPGAMDNHADRPEVIDAIRTPFGTSVRYSHTLQQPMLYMAHTVRENSTVLGTVRTAIPLAAVDSRLRTTRRTIIVGAMFGVLVAMGVGIAVARQITVPITEMTRVAEQMGGGDYNARLHFRRHDEVGILGDTLGRLGNEITQRIATISHDQAQLRAMIAGMVEGVIAVDRDDRILQCNQAAATALGIDATMAAGRKLWEIVRIPGIVDLLEDARAGRGPVQREVTVHRNGGEAILDAHATAFDVEGVGGLVVVLHDISDLRRLERVRRDFVANVSHELKTPLTNIKGYVETLLDGALYDERHNLRFLQKIDAHVSRLTDLVGDLLNLAHIEAQEGSLPVAPVDWRTVVDETLRGYETALEHKRLTCVVQGTDTRVPVLGDRAAMRHIVDNLFDNAVKYTPPGGTITIRLTADGRYGRLEVEDTGVGIPEEDRERIFERFYRVDKARSRQLGGTGLGLAIVKHCAQAMGGDVHVDSRLGQGSRFVVRLPRAR